MNVSSRAATSSLPLTFQRLEYFNIVILLGYWKCSLHWTENNFSGFLNRVAVKLLLKMYVTALIVLYAIIVVWMKTISINSFLLAAFFSHSSRSISFSNFQWVRRHVCSFFRFDVLKKDFESLFVFSVSEPWKHTQWKEASDTFFYAKQCTGNVTNGQWRFVFLFTLKFSL